MRTMAILQFQPWDTLVMRVSDLLSTAGEGAIAFLLALAVAFVGWIIARLVRALLLLILRAVRFNEGVRGLFGMRNGLARYEPASIAAWAAYWTLFVTGVMIAIDTLGFDLVGSVGERLRDVVPRVIVATVLLLVGLAAAMVMGALTRRTFESAGVSGGPLRGHVVTALVTGFAILAAIEQLGFATQFVMGIGLIVVAAVGLALGLSFGLGCRELARDFVVEYLRSLEPEGPKRPR